MDTRILAVRSFPAGQEPTSSVRKHPRRITFNGNPMTAEQQQCLESLEWSLGLRLPDRDYWCDRLDLLAGIDK